MVHYMIHMVLIIQDYINIFLYNNNNNKKGRIIYCGYWVNDLYHNRGK